MNKKPKTMLTFRKKEWKGIDETLEKTKNWVQEFQTWLSEEKFLERNNDEILNKECESGAKKLW